MNDINEITSICLSHIGKRLNHEDNFLLDDSYLSPSLQHQLKTHSCYSILHTNSSKLHLFAVSDGMGGHNAGEIASRICVEQLAMAYNELQKLTSINEAVAYLQITISKINDIVCNMSCEHSELRDMGATLVLLVIWENECAILNIGDSRAYFFCNNTITQITKDHTEGQRILDLGLLSRKELFNFPARKNLNRYIGYNQKGYILRADEYYPLLKNGIFLLCSDGISDFISDTRISEILCTETNLELAGKKLINEAVDTSNSDNATAILIPFRR